MRYGFILAIFSCLSPPASNSQNQFEVAFPNLTFDQPVDLQHPPEGSERLLVVEQAGIIQVFDNHPNVMAKQVFLDISDRIVSGGEMGLLGLAFHPDYVNNGYFYVNYTTGGPRRTVVSRFEVSAGNTDSASPDSEFITL
ncbi:MAG: PQQ-dependent sugar dehydrogenase, partial [Candidatus Marinimicrobia bacterium]|nr:PQQ-dependent sugar dehydrogenase [Candidatus Neomarinimicrobiota bacterium]